jgi:hypothetical protein
MSGALATPPGVEGFHLTGVITLAPRNCELIARSLTEGPGPGVFALDGLGSGRAALVPDAVQACSVERGSDASLPLGSGVAGVSSL